MYKRCVFYLRLRFKMYRQKSRLIIFGNNMDGVSSHRHIVTETPKTLNFEAPSILATVAVIYSLLIEST